MKIIKKLIWKKSRWQRTHDAVKALVEVCKEIDEDARQAMNTGKIFQAHMMSRSLDRFCKEWIDFLEIHGEGEKKNAKH